MKWLVHFMADSRVPRNERKNDEWRKKQELGGEVKSICLSNCV